MKIKFNYYSIYPGELDCAKEKLKRYKAFLKEYQELNKKLPGHLNVHLHNEVCYHELEVTHQLERCIDWYENFIEYCEKDKNEFN